MTTRPYPSGRALGVFICRLGALLSSGPPSQEIMQFIQTQTPSERLPAEVPKQQLSTDNSQAKVVPKRNSPSEHVPPKLSNRKLQSERSQAKVLSTISKAKASKRWIPNEGPRRKIPSESSQAKDPKRTIL